MSAPLSDLGRARDQSGEVLAVEALGGGLVEITVRLPHLGRELTQRSPIAAPIASSMG